MFKGMRTWLLTLAFLFSRERIGVVVDVQDTGVPMGANVRDVSCRTGKRDEGVGHPLGQTKQRFQTSEMMK
jgi:hypothetical protein